MNKKVVNKVAAKKSSSTVKVPEKIAQVVPIKEPVKTRILTAEGWKRLAAKQKPVEKKAPLPLQTLRMLKRRDDYHLCTSSHGFNPPSWQAAFESARPPIA